MTIPGHTKEQDIADYWNQIKRKEQELAGLRRYVLALEGQEQL